MKYCRTSTAKTRFFTLVYHKTPQYSPVFLTHPVRNGWLHIYYHMQLKLMECDEIRIKEDLRRIWRNLKILCVCILAVAAGAACLWRLSITWEQKWKCQTTLKSRLQCSLENALNVSHYSAQFRMTGFEFSQVSTENNVQYSTLQYSLEIIQ